jgi:hypothetical protein
LLRIKDQQDVGKLKLSHINEHFESILEGELKKIEDLVKVWLCGPPKMGESIC